jgi:hypothetical protein
VSPVILLGLVVMWAVVLIPMWLKRHDEVEETRSVDRFTTAMHTLSRREAPAEKRRYVVMPHRSSSHEVHVSGASADGRRTPGRPSVRTPRRAVSAATRRRRTLTGLLVTAGVTLLAAIFVGGVALWVLQLIVDLAVVAFVAHLRTQARARAAVARQLRRRTTARATPQVDPVYDDRATAAERYVEDVDEERYEARDDEPYERFEPVAVRGSSAAAAAEAIFDQTVTGPPVRYRFDDTSYEAVAPESVFDQSVAFEAPTLPPQPVDTPTDADIDIDLSAPAGSSADDDGEIGARPWAPVPVPKPTYASKPAAPRRTRALPEFEPLLPPVETASELDPVDDLEEILDRRWAVND